MAFGDLKGTLTGSVASVTNPTDATGSVSVAVGDLVYCTFAQQTNLTVTAASDNLGNTYSAVNAGTDGGDATARCFYSRVTVAGTLTTVSFAATASGNDASCIADVIEGPFVVSPLDANPANGTDVTSPYTCPATGTLAQADEVVMAAIAIKGNLTVVATSPSTIAGTVARANISCGQSRRVVSATTSVAPEFTAGVNDHSVQVTASFKKLAGATLAADGGSYAVTGQTANLKVGHKVAANAGSYAITGQTASLEYGYKVAAVAGSYTITGQTVNLRITHKLAAEAGSYSISGQVASLEYGRKLTAEAGSYVITGSDAGLIASSSPNKVLIADPGSYVVTGQAASLERGYYVTATPGSYVLTGSDANLEYGYRVTATAGSFAITGQSASLLVGRHLVAAGGSYAITGATASLINTRKIVAGSGSYTITGSDADLEKTGQVSFTPAVSQGANMSQSARVGSNMSGSISVGARMTPRLEQ